MAIDLDTPKSPRQLKSLAISSIRAVTLPLIASPKTTGVGYVVSFSVLDDLGTATGQTISVDIAPDHAAASAIATKMGDVETGLRNAVKSTVL